MQQSHPPRVAEHGGHIVANSTTPMPVTDRGAYNAGKNPSAQLRPSCGLPVANRNSSPRPMPYCRDLLERREAFRGTAALNRDTAVAVTAWAGSPVSGSLRRVSRAELPIVGPIRTVSTPLGDLSALVLLDMSENSLSAQIPEEFSRLSALELLRLTGNALMDCIPLRLQALPQGTCCLSTPPSCAPPASGNLSTTSAENSISPAPYHPQSCRVIAA